MQIGIGLQASRTRLSFVIGFLLSALAVCPEPALAGRDYGFEPETQTEHAEVLARPQTLFHTRAIAVPTNRFRGQWDHLLRSVGGGRAISGLCGVGAVCSEAISGWLSYLSEIRSFPRKKQIALVNRYVNWHIRYTDDQLAYGAKDYWATPFQSIGNRGDCEDYATAKYFSLLSLGFSDEQVRLVIVRDIDIGQIHALTAVTMDGEVYILDNRFERVLRDSQISRYRPIYSFNLSQNWMHLPG